MYDGSNYRRASGFNLDGLKNGFCARMWSFNSQGLFWQIQFLTSSPQTQFLHKSLQEKSLDWSAADTSEWGEEPATAEVEVNRAHSGTGWNSHSSTHEQTNQRLTRSFCLSGGESEETGSRTSHFSVTGWTSTADRGSRIFTRTSSFPPVAFRPSITYATQFTFFSNACLGVCACVCVCLQCSPPQCLSHHSVFPDLPVSAEQPPRLCRTWKDLWEKK